VKRKGKIELPENIFNVEINEHALYEAIKEFLNNQRQGNCENKNKG